MITIRVLYFFIALAVLLVVLFVTGGIYYLRARRRKKYPYGRWEDILKRLTIVDHDCIELIARDFEDNSAEREAGLDRSEICEMLDGMKGLEELERNCDVLVDLVFYVQQWYPEALVITEQMRQSAREIRWHIEELKGAQKTGRFDEWFPDYAQRIVAKYYRMTKQVLTLYEQGGFPGAAELQRAL